MKARFRFALTALIAATLLGATASPRAGAIYRCGNEYRQTPCTGTPTGTSTGVSTSTSTTAGDVRVVAANDVVSIVERTEAERSAESARRLAESLARDRRERERARPAAATSLGPAKQPVEARAAASASLQPKRKAKAKIRVVDGDDFVAKVPNAKNPASQPR